MQTRSQFTKRKAKVPTAPPIRNAVYGEEELPRGLINLKKPPDVLSSWIGKNPENIVQSASPLKGTGFNEIAWRDKDGSKLYLENLDSVGVINERLKITYPEVKSLGQMSGWTNPLPDTIVVKSAGSQQIRMAAKKMVLGLLDSYQTELNPTNKPILKETKTDNPSLGEFAIEFSVKGITQIEPIMGLGTYLDNYSRVFSEGLSRALMTYQNNLKAGVVNGFRVEEVAARQGGAARKMFQDIKGAAEDLQSALEAEIADNKKKQKVTAGPGLHTLQEELATLKSMQTQVVSAIKDGFKNEFDTRRWQQWRALNPRTEDEIVPGTGEKIGTGLQGAVFKYELDPALARRPVVLKYDGNGLNTDAIGAGIPQLNPQQSVRAVAASKMSEQLNLSIIPKTEFFVGTDDNGRPKLGQAMDVVNGAIGQRSVGFKNQEIIGQTDIKNYQDLENIVNNPGKYTQFEFQNARDTLYQTAVKVKDRWYKFDIFPVDINYDNPVVQKGLSDLQVFDYIIGHADRNPGNWIYEKQGDTIIGVKGIDNDDTFGEKWSPERSKTPGIPPIVDISTALSILSADFNKVIKPLLAGLSPNEITRAAERFAQAQQEVVQRVMAGKIASKGDDAAGDQAKLQQLGILTNMPAQPGILRWGDQGIAGDHTQQNSYLGFQLAAKNRLAQQYPQSRGVISESGDALV